MKPSYVDLPEGECAEVGDILSRVGDKWTVLVIVALADGTLRFSELKRKIENISQKMLTATLRNLERDGFVTREVTPTIPPRVDYTLTALGLDVLTPLRALADWVIEKRYKIRAARASFDGHPADEPRHASDAEHRREIEPLVPAHSGTGS